MFQLSHMYQWFKNKMISEINDFISIFLVERGVMTDISNVKGKYIYICDVPYKAFAATE